MGNTNEKIINLENLQRYDENIKKLIPKEKELTQAEYDALSLEEQNNGTIYFISDGESGGENESSGGIDGKGSQMTIMHTINAAPVIISDTYKSLIEIQFSSTSGNSVIFLTLNPNIATDGDLNIKIIVDTQLCHEFTQHCVIGKNIVSINCPLVDLLNGEHKLIVQIKGDSTTGVFDNGAGYLTLIGNGVLMPEGEISFKAYINVTAVKDAVVTAVSGDNLYSATANDTGVAKITIKNPGNYSISGTVNDVISNTVTVDVTQNGNTYSTEINFITLTLTSPEGSDIKITKGDFNIAKTSTSIDLFYLPSTGQYNVTITKDDESATATVDVTEYKNYELSLSYAHIYGATWDGSSKTSWTRTDDAKDFGECNPYYAEMSDNPSSPFDNIMPWSGMVKEDRIGGKMVAIPKFWYKLTQNTDNPGMTIQIADKYVDGFNVSPAHMARFDGDHERDVVYIGKWHCGEKNYMSVSGQLPKTNITRATAREEIHKLGENIWQSDFAMRFTIWLLYIVEFADWNSQEKIGYGCGNGIGTEKSGQSDYIPYHTGTRKAQRNEYGVGTQYRYIEGLWDNCYNWCDGCYNDNNGLNIIINPKDFSDNANGTSVGTPSSGYSSTFSVETKGSFPIFIPTSAGGNGSTHSCDAWGFNASDSCVFVGGDTSKVISRGLFCVSCYSALNFNTSIGCRLMELP